MALPAQPYELRDLPGPRAPPLWLAPWRARPQGPTLAWSACAGWQELPAPADQAGAPCSAALAARRFEPPWRRSGLLRPTDAPDERMPGAEGRRVVRLLGVLLCQTGSGLWARPVVGGQWRPCPWGGSAAVDPALAEGFEVEPRRLGGGRLLLFLRAAAGGSGALASVLCYDAERGEWLAMKPPTRPRLGGHVGEAPVRWRPDNGGGRAADDEPLRAWMLECTPEHIVLLAPVSRGGTQRGTGDCHSALHFLMHSGEVVSHHLPCHYWQLTSQRYDGYFLFVRDPVEGLAASPDASIMDDNRLPFDGKVVAWLVFAAEAAVPPMPVHLPWDEAESGGTTRWSMALSRGIGPGRLPRLVLLEQEQGVVQLWASRSLDRVGDTLYERHSLDGRQLLRHALVLEALSGSELDIEGLGLAAVGAAAQRLLWSPELRCVARVDGAAGRFAGRMAFWCCGGTPSAPPPAVQTTFAQAFAAAAELVPEGFAADYAPLGFQAWVGGRLPSESAKGRAVVTGLPCFGTMRLGEGSFRRPEDAWIHPVGHGLAVHTPLAVYQ